MRLPARVWRQRLWVGLLLVAVGQTLIFVHSTPLSDFYFPIIWFGYVVTLDGLLGILGIRPPSANPAAFMLMIAVSAVFWWVFEGFDLAVRNWRYLGGGEFSGGWHVVYASICFSTVLPAIWETATLVAAGLGRFTRLTRRGVGRCVDLGLELAVSTPPLTVSAQTAGLMLAAELCGVACVVLPIIAPDYAFGLIWGSMLFLLDPVNYALGRRSLILDASRGELNRIVAFALAGPVCGFFWEFWNNWATVHWVYTVPHMDGVWRLFQMPLPGYLGYVPFGLEAYVATILVIPTLLQWRRVHPSSIRKVSVSVGADQAAS